MKVILQKDVARIGRKNEIKEVPDGHALNFLIPRKLAVPATPENVKRITETKGKLAAHKAGMDALVLETIETLSTMPFTMKVEANKEGHLFKGIKASDIAEAVTKERGALPEAALSLPHPIKEVGAHTISVTVGTSEKSFTLIIEAK